MSNRAFGVVVRSFAAASCFALNVGSPRFGMRSPVKILKLARNLGRSFYNDSKDFIRL